MKKTLLFNLILALSLVSFGQSGYLKLIESEKFEKAEKKIIDELNAKPNDVAINYTMAILLINRKYKGFDSEKSFKFITKTNELFNRVLDEKEIKKLNKIPINQLEIDNITDTISRCAMEDAIKINSLEIYEIYLSVCKNVPLKYVGVIIQHRDIVAYQIACSTNSAESYQYFINHYPDAVQKQEAILKRDELAFALVSAIDRIDN